MTVKQVPSCRSQLQNAVAFGSQRYGSSVRFSGDDNSSSQAPVDVWVKRYETHRPINDARIVDLATGESWTTGKNGYAHFSVEPGRTLTLALRQKGYPDLQTASVTVPPEGLTDVNNEITLQVAGKFLYKLLKLGLGKPEPGKHHIIATVSAAGKNLHDDEGEDGVTVTLHSADGTIAHENPIYLGKMWGRTEWFRPILSSRIPFLKHFAHKATSRDGAVIFRNVEPIFDQDGKPVDYILKASKADAEGNPLSFRTARVTIFPDSPEGINVSPPLGPRISEE